MNKAKLAQIVGEIEKEMTRELNYTAMRLEDFDYRRNLNDRFLTDILDSKKVVLLDSLGIFKASDNTVLVNEETKNSTDENGETKVAVES